MDMNEFKAWLDGYTQAKGGSLVQFDIEIIKQKLDEVYPIVPSMIPAPFYPWTPVPAQPWYVEYVPSTTSGTHTNQPSTLSQFG